jgi:hypothetical protein
VKVILTVLLSVFVGTVVIGLSSPCFAQHRVVDPGGGPIPSPSHILNVARNISVPVTPDQSFDSEPEKTGRKDMGIEGEGEISSLTIPKELLAEFRTEITTTRAPLSRDQLIRLMIHKARTGQGVGEFIREAVEEKLLKVNL